MKKFTIHYSINGIDYSIEMKAPSQTLAKMRVLQKFGIGCIITGIDKN